MSRVSGYVASVLDQIETETFHQGELSFYCQYPERSPEVQEPVAFEVRCKSCLLGLEAELRLTDMTGPITDRDGTRLYGDDRLEVLARLRHLAKTSGVKPLAPIEPDKKDWPKL